MKVNAKDVKQLIELLAEKNNEMADYGSFERIGDVFEKEKKPIRGRYLYDIYRQSSKAVEQNVEFISGRKSLLDIIARSIGYNSFFSYQKIINQKIPNLLKGYIGNWWSLVRANAGEFILKAPVEFYIDENSDHLCIRMQGGVQLFKGTAKLRGGNLFCELDSEREKIFYFVMKVAAIDNADVLQGIFAGMSSAGDPIGGREVFMRAKEETFEEMKWQKLNLNDASIEAEVRNYFQSYEKNCLKINKVSRFSLDDLML